MPTIHAVFSAASGCSHSARRRSGDSMARRTITRPASSTSAGTSRIPQHPASTATSTGRALARPLPPAGQRCSSGNDVMICPEPSPTPTVTIHDRSARSPSASSTSTS